MKPSVCIDAVFENLSLAEACAKVKASGISAIEFWAWWEKDLDELEAAIKDSDLTIAACCTKFISLTDPALRSDYLEGLRESIVAAKRLGCEILISQVGDFRVGVPADEQHQSLVDGLKEAAPLLEAAGITLVIEPLNELVDHEGYYLVQSDEAFDIVDEVGSDRVRVAFDIYHQQISEGNLISNILPNIEKIGHFHAAGNPGRHELQVGEINYPQVFAALQSTGYDGYIGLEYWPIAEDPAEPLREVAALLSGSSN
jgi:hydroxypyruvate isomerase